MGAILAVLGIVLWRGKDLPEVPLATPRALAALGIVVALYSVYTSYDHYRLHELRENVSYLQGDSLRILLASAASIAAGGLLLHPKALADPGWAQEFLRVHGAKLAIAVFAIGLVSIGFGSLHYLSPEEHV